MLVIITKIYLTFFFIKIFLEKERSEFSRFPDSDQ